MKQYSVTRTGITVLMTALLVLAAGSSVLAGVGGPYPLDFTAPTVALYHLDGNATDASANGFNGTLVGSDNAWISAAKFAGGLEATGPGIGGFNSTVTQQSGHPGFSLEGWFRPSTSGTQYLLGSADAPELPNFYVRMNDDGSVACGIMGIYSPSSWSECATGPGLVTPGNWVHIAITGEMTATAHTTRLYVNNSLKGTIVGCPFDWTNLIVGRCPWADTGEYGKFTGQIDEVRVSSGVTKNFSTFGGPYTPDANTVSLLHLNGNVTDASTNNNNGVLAGTTNWVTSALFSGGLGAPGPGFGGLDIPVTLANFTAEGWFRPTANGQWLLGGANIALDQMFYTRINGDGQFAWGVLSPSYGWSEQWAGMNAVPLNVWTHIAFTTEYQELAWVSKLYVNGVLKDTIANATNINNIILGRIPWAPSYTSGYMIGQIDEVRISDSVRTDFSGTVMSNVATPTFSPDGGTFAGATNVTVSCATPGAVIRCTTTGVDPVETDPVVTSGSTVVVDSTLTLRAKAWATDFLPSAVKASNYIIASSLNRPEIIYPASSIMIDGSLADWNSADFVPLDKTYDGNPTDIPEAYYAAKWASDGDKVYVAVKVRDTSHHFTDTYSDWTNRDAVEIYLHTTGQGMLDYYADQILAQQYTVGIKQSNRSVVWSTLGYNMPIPVGNASQFAGKEGTGADSQWLFYEAALTAYQSQPDVISTLHAGDVIGLDVCAVGNNGAYSGMRSENYMANKAYDFSMFGLHLLAPNATSISGLKSAANDTFAAFSGIVTASFDGYFYLETSDRASGIRVQKTSYTATVGKSATVAGTAKTDSDSGERFIDAVSASEKTGSALLPLGITNKSLGGGSFGLQSGVVGGIGLNNIGLLVKTTGRVSNGSGSRFQIDDGSGVLLNAVVASGGIPANNSYVVLTGIMSCEKSDGDIQRLILVTQYTAR